MQNKVTNNIRKLRFDAGEMTQEALARQAGVSRQTIHAIESGKYIPSLPLALKMARFFDLKVEDIFKLEE